MVVTVPRRKALPLEIERAPPQQEVQLLVRLPNRRVEPLVDDIQQPVHHACSQSRRVNVMSAKAKRQEQNARRSRNQWIVQKD